MSFWLQKEITFKAVKKDIDIGKLENGEYNLTEIVDTKKDYYVLGKYEDQDVVIKKGRYGLYITWGENTKTLKKLGNRPIESIKFTDVEPFLKEGTGIVREISDNISIRKSKRGDYIFFKTPKMKKPSFLSIKDFNDDYITCDINILSGWIKSKYNVY